MGTRQKVRGVHEKEMSQAFHDKSKEILKTLRASVATTLQNDMLRLLEEELHTDIVLTNGREVVKAHLSILQCRFKERWKSNWVNQHFNNEDNVIEVKGVTSGQLCSFVRQLYTVTEAELLVEEFLPHLPDNQSLQETSAERSTHSSNPSPSLSDSEQAVEQPLNQDGSEFHLEKDKESKNNDRDECHTVSNAQSDSLDQSASESNFEISDDISIRIEQDAISESDLPCLATDSDNLPACGSSNNNTRVTETKDSLVNTLSDPSKPNRPPSVVDIPHETCSCLGTDFLRMYLNQENCNCCIVVDGHKFPAHKCILSARSDYFEAMLGGHWMESQSDEVTLEGVSPEAVKHLLLFLYGGVLDLPSQDVSADLLDLFQVADMYGVSSLNKVLSFYLRRDLCHFFHKPCSVCVLTAADALSLCHNFNLEDLEQRCLKWIAKNFTKIWPSKTFAGLPDDLQQLSLRSIMAQFTPVNVLDIIVECDRLTSSLPRVKWTEAVLCLLTLLMDAAIEFTSTNFVRVIKNPDFLQWAQGATWKAGTLKGIFTSALDSLPITNACHVFQALLHLQAVVKLDSEAGESSGTSQVGDEVTELLEAMVQRCERFLRMHIHKVMRSSQWSELPKPVQTRIMETSAYLSLADLPEPKPRPVARKPITVRHVAPPRSVPASETNRHRARVTPPRIPSNVPAVRPRAAQDVFTQNSSAQNLSIRNQNLNQTSNQRQQQMRSTQRPSSGSQNARQATNTGARPKSKALNQAVNLPQSKGNGASASGGVEQGLAQSNEKCGNDENRVEDTQNNIGNESDHVDIPGSLVCPNDTPCDTRLDNDFTCNTNVAFAEATSNKKFSLSSDRLLSLEDGTCNTVNNAPEKSLNTDPTCTLSTNGCEHSLSRQKEYLVSLPESTANDPDGLDIHVYQRSASQEHSPRLRTSRLPVAAGSSLSRSPRQRWSVGSSDSFDAHHHPNGTGEVSVANIPRPEVSRSMSLPPEAQVDKTSQAEGSATETGTSVDPPNVNEEFPPGEVKIVKMSRPLSVGFIVPSS